MEVLSPVCLVKLHDPFFQLPSLVRGEAELADIVAHVLLGIIVTQLSLHGVGAQQGVRDEGAGQAACDDVRPQLQAQVVSGDRGERAWAWGGPTPSLDAPNHSFIWIHQLQTNRYSAQRGIFPDMPCVNTGRSCVNALGIS